MRMLGDRVACGIATRIVLFATTALACISVEQSAEGQANNLHVDYCNAESEGPSSSVRAPCPKQEEDNIFAKRAKWKPTPPSESEKAQGRSRIQRTRVLAEQAHVEAERSAGLIRHRRRRTEESSFGLAVVSPRRRQRRRLIQYIVGSSYLYGDENLGVILDRAEAAKWYRHHDRQGEDLLASDSANLVACTRRLGRAEGRCSRVHVYNLAAARKAALSTVGLSSGHPRGAYDAAQIAEAQRLTRQWKPKPETDKSLLAPRLAKTQKRQSFRFQQLRQLGDVGGWMRRLLAREQVGRCATAGSCSK